MLKNPLVPICEVGQGHSPHRAALRRQIPVPCLVPSRFSETGNLTPIQLPPGSISAGERAGLQQSLGWGPLGQGQDCCNPLPGCGVSLARAWHAMRMKKESGDSAHLWRCSHFGGHLSGLRRMVSWWLLPRSRGPVSPTGAPALGISS